MNFSNVNYEVSIRSKPTRAGLVFVAETAAFPALRAEASNAHEAYVEITKQIQEMVAAARELNVPLPEPQIIL